MNQFFKSMLLSIVFGAPLSLYADTAPLGFGDSTFHREMQTDRPDFTEGTHTVEPGHFQLESGYTYTYDDNEGASVDTHTFPEFLLRIGLLDDLEGRIIWQGFSFVEEDIDGVGTDDFDGTADMSVGFKHRMYFQDGVIPDLSFIGELGLPVGSQEFTADEVEAAGKFLWAYGLDDTYSLAGNFNVSSLAGEEERYLELGNSVSLGIGLTENVGSYVEYFGLYPLENVVETTEHYVNGGFTYMASSDLQFDIRAGRGINEAANDFFAGAGITFRR